MDINCTHCGHSNKVGLLGIAELARCECCSSLLELPPEARARLGFRWGWVFACVLVCLSVLGLRYSFQAREWNAQVKVEMQRRQEHQAAADKAERAAEAARAARIRQEEENHRKRLADADYIGGASAGRRHAEEWARRQRHDPELATSLMEVNLLKMEKLGRDPAVSALRALKEVATLASPTNSRVMVTAFQDRFILKIAYAHSSLAEGEAGGVTRHQNVKTLRREVEDMSARIARDVLESCGSRGIERLQISYNHGMKFSTIPRAATPAERAELSKRSVVRMARLHRVALDQKRVAGVNDWHSTTLTRIKEMFIVEYDTVDRVNIVFNEPIDDADRKDPVGDLEF